MKEKIYLIANVVGIILLIAGALIAWNYYSEKKRSEYSYKEFELRRALEVGNRERAEQIIKELQDSKDFKPLALSYSIQMEGEDHTRTLKELVDSLKDKDLVSLYTERYAYELYRKGHKEQALKELEKVDSKSFNYTSASVLKAQILMDMGKTDTAKKILEQVSKVSPESYFTNLAKALILVGGE